MGGCAGVCNKGDAEHNVLNTDKDTPHVDNSKNDGETKNNDNNNGNNVNITNDGPPMNTEILQTEKNLQSDNVQKMQPKRTISIYIKIYYITFNILSSRQKIQLC